MIIPSGVINISKGLSQSSAAKTDTFKVGLAFREQVVEKVYADDWDKPLDMLITPDGIIAVDYRQIYLAHIAKILYQRLGVHFACKGVVYTYTS